jgi:hypothetical protein
VDVLAAIALALPPLTQVACRIPYDDLAFLQITPYFQVFAGSLFSGFGAFRPTSY